VVSKSGLIQNNSCLCFLNATHVANVFCDKIIQLANISDPDFYYDVTGAAVPCSVNKSDAVFNFAYAFGALMALPVGVYIAMNGRTLHWSSVRKNSDGEFDESS
jgi:hypothetical protein